MRKSEKGFTLIELAIVMVIIGILIGAVLKGQDLIQNARAKKFVNKVRAWEVADWTFLDRKGRFPGDADGNGKIGDGNYKTDIVDANFINPPYEGATGSETNTITIGSYTFFVFHGTDGGANAGKNVITICKDATCSAFTQDELMYIEALDAALDGTADGSSGQVIGVNDAPGITADEWEAVWATAPTAAAYSTLTQAVVYYFDAKR